jgi:predicted NUDIX family phosphoesterase
MSGVEEEVLVFPADVLDDYLNAFEGGCLSDPAEVRGLVGGALRASFYAMRAVVETDPNVKQIIPYCVLIHPTDDGVFAYRRTKKGGETRLHDLWSIGVGGHVNPEDGGATDGKAYWQAVRREILEETGFRDLYFDTGDMPFRVIYDPSNEVGRVHVGFVHLIVVRDPHAKANDAAIGEGGFVPEAEVWAKLGSLETWSQLAAKAAFDATRSI